MADKEEIRKHIINDIIKFLQQKGEEIGDSNMPIEEQLIQMDVVLDLVKFLGNYKENVKILNDNLSKKSKFDRGDYR